MTVPATLPRPTVAGRGLLLLYRAVTGLATPLIGRHLRTRQRRGREHPDRLAERLGHGQISRPPGSLLWLHAASVGEVTAALPLLQHLHDEFPVASILLTSGTVTSARVAADRLPAGVMHQFIPVDTPGAVRRFYDHWRPAAGIFLESEVWPNLVHEAQRRAIPLMLVNAHMSDASFRGWRRARPMARALFGGFAAVLAQTPEDRHHLATLGAVSAVCTGNLKTAAPPLHADPAEVERCRTAIAGRPCWLAAATHPGEDTTAAQVHRDIAANHPGLLTIIAPRHPDRGAAIAAAIAASGLTVTRRTASATGTLQIDEPWGDIYIADTIGEMGLWYRLCPIAFIGKSLPPNRGGHNPLEAAKLGCAVITGPDTHNFRDLMDELTAAGAVTVVGDTAALTAAIGRLLADPAARAAQTSAADQLLASKASVLTITLDLLRPILAPALAPQLP